MASRVKGIVVEIGGDTTGLDKALKDTNKQINNTQSYLKDVERLLKLDPTNTTLLEQKQRLLAQAVSDTGGKLKILQHAEKQVQDQFKKGDVSRDQYEALQREIVATKQQLGKLEREAGDVNSTIKRINEKPIKEVADAAEEAEDALEKAGKEASVFGDVLKAELSADGLEAVAETLKDVAEESKEYRKIMASLKVSSKDAGYSAKETSQIYKKLYGVLGDDQTAATTVANLQALHLEQSRLQTITSGTIGAWAKFGDSIPIDGLAEAINETVKTGQVTGNLADVLNWGSKAGETFGVTMKANTEANKEWNNSVADAKSAEDYFNLALKECSSEAERTNLILQMMANQGLTSAGEAWQKNNQSMIESNQAQATMQEQLAELGETVEPIFTKITNAVATALAWFNSLDDGTQTYILTIIGLIAAIATLAPIVSGAITLFNGLSAVMGFLAANPIVLIIAAVVALVATFVILWNKCEAFRNFWINLWNGIKSTTVNTVNGILRSTEAFINGIINGVNFLLRAVNKISIDVPAWVPEIGGKRFGFNIPELANVSLPQLAKGGKVLRGSAIVGEAGPELLSVMPGRTIVQPLTNNTTNHNSTSLGNVTINVYGAQGQDVHQLAEIVMDKFESIYASKEVALI